MTSSSTDPLLRSIALECFAQHPFPNSQLIVLSEGMNAHGLIAELTVELLGRRRTHNTINNTTDHSLLPAAAAFFSPTPLFLLLLTSFSPSSPTSSSVPPPSSTASATSTNPPSTTVSSTLLQQSVQEALRVAAMGAGGRGGANLTPISVSIIEEGMSPKERSALYQKGGVVAVHCRTLIADILHKRLSVECSVAGAAALFDDDEKTNVSRGGGSGRGSTMTMVQWTTLSFAMELLTEAALQQQQQQRMTTMMMVPHPATTSSSSFESVVRAAEATTATGTPKLFLIGEGGARLTQSILHHARDPMTLLRQLKVGDVQLYPRFRLSVQQYYEQQQPPQPHPQREADPPRGAGRRPVETTSSSSSSDSPTLRTDHIDYTHDLPTLQVAQCLACITQEVLQELQRREGATLAQHLQYLQEHAGRTQTMAAHDGNNGEEAESHSRMTSKDPHRHRTVPAGAVPQTTIASLRPAAGAWRVDTAASTGTVPFAHLYPSGICFQHVTADVLRNAAWNGLDRSLRRSLWSSRGSMAAIRPLVESFVALRRLQLLLFRNTPSVFYIALERAIIRGSGGGGGGGWSSNHRGPGGGGTTAAAEWTLSRRFPELLDIAASRVFHVSQPRNALSSSVSLSGTITIPTVAVSGGRPEGSEPQRVPVPVFAWLPPLRSMVAGWVRSMRRKYRQRTATTATECSGDLGGAARRRVTATSLLILVPGREAVRHCVTGLRTGGWSGGSGQATATADAIAATIELNLFLWKYQRLHGVSLDEQAVQRMLSEQEPFTFPSAGAPAAATITSAAAGGVASLSSASTKNSSVRTRRRCRPSGSGHDDEEDGGDVEDAKADEEEDEEMMEKERDDDDQIVLTLAEMTFPAGRPTGNHSSTTTTTAASEESVVATCQSLLTQPFLPLQTPPLPPRMEDHRNENDQPAPSSSSSTTAEADPATLVEVSATGIVLQLPLQEDPRLAATTTTTANSNINREVSSSSCCLSIIVADALSLTGPLLEARLRGDPSSGDRGSSSSGSGSSSGSSSPPVGRVIVIDGDLRCHRLLEGALQRLRDRSPTGSRIDNVAAAGGAGAAAAAAAASSSTSVAVVQVLDSAVARQERTAALHAERTQFQQLVVWKAQLPVELLTTAASRRDVLRDLRKGTVPSSRRRPNNESNNTHSHNRSSVEEDGSSAPPVLVYDDREMRSTFPYYLHQAGFALVPLTLLHGDYILSTRCAIERKALPDLIASLQSGRLATQLRELSRLYPRPVLLIEFNPEDDFFVSDAALSLGSLSPHNSRFPPPLQRYGAASRGTGSVLRRLAAVCAAYPLVTVLWCRHAAHASQLLYRIRSEFQDIGQPVDPTDAALTERKDGEAQAELLHAMRILRRFPGVTAANLQPLIEACGSLQGLATLSEAQLVQAMGAENGKRLHRWLHRPLVNVIT